MTQFRKFGSILFLLLIIVLPLLAQESSSTPVRTPEQEAGRQTERLQKELQLSAEQSRQIYEINLRYARLRQTSNSRSEAMERIKNKDAELQKVLTTTQYSTLQSMRFERSRFNTNSTNSTVAPRTNYDPSVRRSRAGIPSAYPRNPVSESRDARAMPRAGGRLERRSTPSSSPSGGRSAAPRSSTPPSQNRR